MQLSRRNFLTTSLATLTTLTALSSLASSNNPYARTRDFRDSSFRDSDLSSKLGPELQKLREEKERAKFIFSYNEWKSAQKAYELWKQQRKQTAERESSSDPNWELVRQKAGRICKHPDKTLNLFSEEERKLYALELKLIYPHEEIAPLSRFYGIDINKRENFPGALIVLYLDHRYGYKKSDEKVKQPLTTQNSQ